MKSERIGNDLNIVWSLLSGDQPFNIEGRDVTIYLKSAFRKTEIKDFNLSGNKVLWTFYGKDQKQTGIYSLELVVNNGKEGMITTDACNFVNLVNCSCKIQNSEDAPNVETESIELTSTLEYEALSLKPNKEDIPSWIYSAITIEPLSDSSAIIKAFNDNDLANKLNTPILCFIKKERFDKDYTMSVLVVEDYTKEAGYRLTFTLLGLKSDAKSGDMQAIYSPDVFTAQRVLSYLYNKTSGYVIPLGDGSVKDRRIDELIDNAITTENIKEKIDEAANEIIEKIRDNFASKNDIQTLSNLKQDTITDLATIRIGAAKGATALQSVPEEYVKDSELKTINGEKVFGTGTIRFPVLKTLGITLDEIQTDDEYKVIVDPNDTLQSLRQYIYDCIKYEKYIPGPTTVSWGDSIYYLQNSWFQYKKEHYQKPEDIKQAIVAFGHRQIVHDIDLTIVLEIQQDYLYVYTYEL